jgi:hypothetical protein
MCVLAFSEHPHHYTTTSPPTPDHVLHRQPLITQPAQGWRADAPNATAAVYAMLGRLGLPVSSFQLEEIAASAEGLDQMQLSSEGGKVRCWCMVVVHGGGARLMRLSFRSVRTCELQRG